MMRIEGGLQDDELDYSWMYCSIKQTEKNHLLSVASVTAQLYTIIVIKDKI